MTFGVCSPSGLFPKRISRRYYLFKIRKRLKIAASSEFTVPCLKFRLIATVPPFSETPGAMVCANRRINIHAKSAIQRSRCPFYRAAAQSAGYFVNPFKLLGRKGGVVYRLDIIEYL